MKEILKIENAVRVHKNKREVNELSLSLDSEETALIFGPAGCGKTSLFRLICGLDFLNSGSISICQMNIKDLRKINLFEMVGAIPKYDGLIGEYSILENVALPLSLFGKDNANKTAMALLDRLDIKYIASAKPFRVSSLERKLACLARSVILNPKLIIIDEYTASFNEREEEILLKRLKEFIDEKNMALLLLSTEDYSMQFTHRYSMKHGKLTEVL